VFGVRIVSLVPHATELLFELGLDAEIIAVTHECDYPAAARELPRVTRDALPPGLSAGEIDAAVCERVENGRAIYELDDELVAHLSPDLIVAQALCPVCAVSYEDVAALAQRIPSRPRVISLDPQTFGETLADIRRVGEVTGRQERARELADDAGRRIAAVEAAVRDAPRPRVAALEWFDPVYVAGHWTPQLIELAGGADVLGRPGEPSYRTDWPSVAASQPDVVLAIPCGFDAQRAQAEAVEHAGELAELAAGRVVALDASAYFSRPGPRLVDGLELLAHVLHPERVPDAPAEVLEVQPGALAPRA
jgi:iron complex transport system substrate-binding protein